jgi:ankyrin repeat protein
VTTNDGWTALHLALKNGHVDIARLLLEQNASIDLVNTHGSTALHLTLETSEAKAHACGNHMP